MQIFAHSPGKVIISGEHSVVYGQPALVGGLKLFREVVVDFGSKKQVRQSGFIKNLLNIFNKKLGTDIRNIEVSDLGRLPIGMGLGSSAAYAHAVYLALLKYTGHKLTKQELFDIVQESEQYSHGNPSGADATAVVYGGLLKFLRDSDKVQVTHLSHNTSFGDLDMFLVDSGRPVESTKDMVGMVQANMQRNSDFRFVISQMGELTNQLIEDLNNNKFDANLIRINQRYLDLLGIVSNRARRIINMIDGVGGAAKITGAGGIVEGSGMILAVGSAVKLEELFKDNHLRYFLINF